MKETVLIDIESLEQNIGQLDGVPANPRSISKERMEALSRSIEGLPDMMELRELLVYPRDGGFVVLGGNQRLAACRKLGWREVPCKVIDTDTPSAILRRIAMLDNEPFGVTEWGVAASEWNLAELQGWGVDVPKEWMDAVTKWNRETQEDGTDGQGEGDEAIDDEDGGGGTEDAGEPSEDGEVLDVLFPSDNDFEIPVLLKERMAGRLELPVTPWGANSRLKNDVRTYHFYVEDYRFEKLFRDPFNLIMSGCRSIIEPNCSLHDQTPIAWVCSRYTRSGGWHGTARRRASTCTLT